MDTRSGSAAELFGKLLGMILVACLIVVTFAVILTLSWNCCVPQLFGGSEIDIRQSFAMLGIVWTASAMTRVRV